jgi:hypothetical protein
LNDVNIQEHHDDRCDIRSIVTDILNGEKHDAESKKTVVELMSDEDADEARKYFGVF